MAAREERELVFRKGKWIDYPFEPCWNEYWLYTSTRILQQPLLQLEDVAAHLWLCARYHQDHPAASAYTWGELAAVWLGNPAREKAAKAIVARLEAAGLLEVEHRRGRGKRSHFIPYDPLQEADFRLAAAQGCFDIPAREHVVANIPPAELAAFDFTQARESYRLLKPRSFLRGRGWEPCLRTVFDLYLGSLVDIQERAGQSCVPLPGPAEQDGAALLPWDEPPLTRGRAVIRLTTTPLLSLAAISLALWLRKRADQARLQRQPWVTVSVSRIRRQFHLRWTTVEALLTALEDAGLARRVGGGRQAGPNNANVALRFLLWDPCEKASDFLSEVGAGEITSQLSPLGTAATKLLSPPAKSPRRSHSSVEPGTEARKPAHQEQGQRKPAQREQGTIRTLENPPNGSKGSSQNPTNRKKGAPTILPSVGGQHRQKPSEREQHEHILTNNEITTTIWPAVVVTLLAEIEITPEQIPSTVAPVDVEELVVALSAVQPGSPGYDSRREVAWSWLQDGPAAAVLTYLAAAAGIQSAVARQKRLHELPLTYVQAVTAYVWTQVHGTPDYKYLAARVVRWLEAQDPLPESHARQLRFSLLRDDNDPAPETSPPQAPAAAPPDGREAYAEFLGVPLDLSPWEQILQEIRRLGMAPPDWAPAALLDGDGPRKAGRGAEEVWLLVPGDVDLAAAGEYLWADGVGPIVERTVRRRWGTALPVAVGHYADLRGYLRKLQERARQSWEEIKPLLAGNLPRSDYVTWVEQSRGGDLHLGERRLTVYSQPAALHWLQQDDFAQQARRAAQEVLGAGWSVEVRSAASAAGPPAGGGSGPP